MRLTEQNNRPMDVLGLFANILPRRGPVYRDVEELRIEGCAGCAIGGIGGVARDCVLLFSVAFLCVYCKSLPFPPTFARYGSVLRTSTGDNRNRRRLRTRKHPPIPPLQLLLGYDRILPPGTLDME